MAAILYNKDIS